MAQITFKINDIEHKVDGNYDISLNEYIRNVAGLPGTKYMCKKGGCGACIVAVRASLPPSYEKKIFAVNSCLVSTLSCQDWEIITTEGIGNRTKGYHVVQERLAKFNGTQCGYCTSGWIMNMYCLYESKPKITSKEIENSFAGNLCRCTGYRPIADAFKSFAIDADEELLQKVVDLEDLDTTKPCGVKCKKDCSHKNIVKTCTESDNEDWCMLNMVNNKMVAIDCGTYKWYKAYRLADVFWAMTDGKYKIIAGNTGKGVYSTPHNSENIIDIFNVSELKGYTRDVNLIIGAGMTLADMMELFIEVSQDNNDFSYLKKCYDHMDLVAHIPVRNIGTIGGNLFLKHSHNEFPSDVFLLLETIGAYITIAQWNGWKKTMTLPQFLKTNMDKKIIHSIIIPPYSKQHYSLKTFKIMVRQQNTHAIVNAGFLIDFYPQTNIVRKARIVYGNISKTFIHASKSEKYLVGKDLYKDDTLQGALKTLDDELVAEEMPPEPSAAFRKQLAVNLFYKAILSLCPEHKVDPKFRSGGELIKRDVSKGKQIYDTDKTIWPLNEPIPKIEALSQCSGEATFANDLPHNINECHAAFVLADAPPGSIIGSIEMGEASKIPGVIALYTALDIPGNNSITSKKMIPLLANEEFLCSKKVIFFHQPVAILVADKEETAIEAAKLVKVNYALISTKKPLLTIPDVLNSQETDIRLIKDIVEEPTDKGKNVDQIIEGEFSLGYQFHFTMEPQTCVVQPTEDGFDVYSATQYCDFVQTAVSECLNLPANKVNLIVRRIGGGYGGKITRSTYPACGAALVSYLQGRPCRFIIPLETNMKMIGKRPSTYCKFKVGVNNEGEIQFLDIKMNSDNGCSPNDNDTSHTVLYFKNCYESKRFNIEAYKVLTDTPSNTFCRAPGATEGIAMIEYIINKIAFQLKLDPMVVRYNNFKQDDNIQYMVEKLMKDSDFENRNADIKTYNENNRWKKRSLTLVPLCFKFVYQPSFYATVSLLHADGTVILKHSGVDMGQGINTKAAQVCAYELGVPLENVSVKPTQSCDSPNSNVTGGSFGTDSVCLSTMMACKELKARLEPVIKEMKDATWADIIQEAHSRGIDLKASYFFNNTGQVKNYDIYAVCAIEIEIDILTGNHQLRRVDLLEDVGRSISPEIDVGQIEGSIIMGIGLWTSEEIKVKSSGELLTDNTWTYKIPGIKDIPVDLRIYFRDNGKNELGVLQSKATGEPALCLSAATYHAIHQAVRLARLDAGYDDVWQYIEPPCTVERIFNAIGHKHEHFKLKETKKSE